MLGNRLLRECRATVHHYSQLSKISLMLVVRHERTKGCLGDVTDGIGTPDPNPRNFVNWHL